ncbi:MAG: HupE/UreJ family protein [Elusimicrobiota bacterium]
MKPRNYLPCLLLLAATPALAHTGADAGGGFLMGLRHPLSGLDHMLAMLAVGMWGAQLGSPSLWALPIAFPLVMTLGAGMGILGIPLPGIEIGIVISVVVLGAMVAAAACPPLVISSALVGIFAIFHGHAHGTELPNQANAVTYSLGFVFATGCVHLAGIGIGLVEKLPRGKRLLRAGGLAIAISGIILLYRQFVA